MYTDVLLIWLNLYTLSGFIILQKFEAFYYLCIISNEK